MIKVLYIIYDLERGGPEVRLLNFAKWFSLETSISICVTSNNVSMMQEFLSCNVPVFKLEICRPWIELDKIYKLHRYICENGVQIVNVYDLKGLIISYILTRILHAKVLIIYNNVNSLDNFSGRNKFVAKLLLKRVHGVLCNSMFSRDEICKVVKCRVDVVYNGVDIEHYKCDTRVRRVVRERLGIDDNVILIGIVANFRRQKNHKLLFDVFNNIARIYDEVALICVGGGQLLNDYREYVGNIGILDKVIFTGYVDDVWSYLNAIDIVVLTSIYEGLPNVILEAMSMGKPVVSSDVGGCVELIEDNISGILIESGDADGFTAAISKLIDDKNLYHILSEGSISHVHNKFDMNKMIQSYELYYADMFAQLNNP